MTDRPELKTQAEKRNEAYEEVREMMGALPNHPSHLPEEVEGNVLQAYELLREAYGSQEDYDKYGVDPR